jgi:hypothetical protein
LALRDSEKSGLKVFFSGVFMDRLAKMDKNHEKSLALRAEKISIAVALTKKHRQVGAPLIQRKVRPPLPS